MPFENATMSESHQDTGNKMKTPRFLRSALWAKFLGVLLCDLFASNQFQCFGYTSIISGRYRRTASLC